MAKIVIIGDSLALPREELPVEETYPLVLDKHIDSENKLFINNKRANDTSLQLNNLYDDVYLYNPDVVIIHLGIVDCAPRLFYRKERMIIKKINRIIPIVNIYKKYRYFITKKFPKVYISMEMFEKNMIKILNALEKSKNIKKIIIIGIADTNSINKEKSFSYENNIIKYNNILKKVSNKSSCINFLDIFQYGDDILLEDGIHLNSKGSKILAEELSKKLKDEG